MNFKDLLPLEDFIMESSLSMKELTDRLCNQVARRQGSDLLGNPRVSTDYQGEIFPDGFKISRVITYRNSFLPEIKGSFKPAGRNTMVSIKMRMDSFVQTFGILWMSLVGLVCLGTSVYLIVSLKRGTFGSVSPMLAIPFAMFVFGFLLFTRAFKSESSRSKDDLKSLLQAKIVE